MGCTRPAAHRCRIFNFMPTFCSRMNAVEGLFQKLAHRRHERGVYDSIEYLKTSTRDFI